MTLSDEERLRSALANEGVVVGELPSLAVGDSVHVTSVDDLPRARNLKGRREELPPDERNWETNGYGDPPTFVYEGGDVPVIVAPDGDGLVAVTDDEAAATASMEELVGRFDLDPEPTAEELELVDARPVEGTFRAICEGVGRPERGEEFDSWLGYCRVETEEPIDVAATLGVETGDDDMCVTFETGDVPVFAFGDDDGLDLLVDGRGDPTTTNRALRSAVDDLQDARAVTVEAVDWTALAVLDAAAEALDDLRPGYRNRPVPEFGMVFSTVVSTRVNLDRLPSDAGPPEWFDGVVFDPDDHYGYGDDLNGGTVVIFPDGLLVASEPTVEAGTAAIDAAISWLAARDRVDAEVDPTIRIRRQTDRPELSLSTGMDALAELGGDDAGEGDGEAETESDGTVDDPTTDPIQPGDFVHLAVTVRDAESGAVLKTTDEPGAAGALGNSAGVLVGAGETYDDLEAALVGARVGDEGTVEIGPEAAFRHEDLSEVEIPAELLAVETGIDNPHELSVGDHVGVGDALVRADSITSHRLRGTLIDPRIRDREIEYEVLDAHRWADRRS